MYCKVGEFGACDGHAIVDVSTSVAATVAATTPAPPGRGVTGDGLGLGEGDAEFERDGVADETDGESLLGVTFASPDRRFTLSLFSSSTSASDSVSSPEKFPRYDRPSFSVVNLRFGLCARNVETCSYNWMKTEISPGQPNNK